MSADALQNRRGMVPGAQGCCGALALHSSGADDDELQRLYVGNIEAWIKDFS